MDSAVLRQRLDYWYGASRGIHLPMKLLKCFLRNGIGCWGIVRILYDRLIIGGGNGGKNRWRSNLIILGLKRLKNNQLSIPEVSMYYVLLVIDVCKVDMKIYLLNSMESVNLYKPQISKWRLPLTSASINGRKTNISPQPIVRLFPKVESNCPHQGYECVSHHLQWRFGWCMNHWNLSITY